MCVAYGQTESATERVLKTETERERDGEKDGRIKTKEKEEREKTLSSSGPVEHLLRFLLPRRLYTDTSFLPLSVCAAANVSRVHTYYIIVVLTYYVSRCTLYIHTHFRIQRYGRSSCRSFLRLHAACWARFISGYTEPKSSTSSTYVS